MVGRRPQGTLFAYCMLANILLGLGFSTVINPTLYFFSGSYLVAAIVSFFVIVLPLVLALVGILYWEETIALLSD